MTASPGRPDLAFAPDRILTAYRAGVGAVSRLGAKVIDWRVRTPCAGWTLLDLAGHVLSAARYYHRLLNAALDGNPLEGLPRGEALAVMNDLDLRTLAEADGPERFLAYEAVAGRYGERLAEVDWDLTIGTWSGLGPRTVGQHALAAVEEWHVHAWDISRAYGWDYRPDDPAVVAAGQIAFPTTRPARRRPSGDLWHDALLAAGRRPVRRSGGR